MKNEATKFFKEYFKVHEQDMVMYDDTIDCMVKFAEKVSNPDMSRKDLKPTNESNNANLLLSAVSLAELVVKILDEKAHRGCNNKVWYGFQNGDGEEVGKDIERIIVKAKKFLSNCR